MNAQSEIYKQRMAAFHRICRLKDVRITPQRLEVFSTLARTNEHPSAEFIHRQVVKRLPTITLDTVYRTLGTLEKEGLVFRVSVVGNTQRSRPIRNAITILSAESVVVSSIFTRRNWTSAYSRAKCPQASTSIGRRLNCAESARNAKRSDVLEIPDSGTNAKRGNQANRIVR